MNIQASQTNAKGTSASPTKAPSAPVIQPQKQAQAPMLAEPKPKEPSPTFANLKSWLVGRDVVIYSAPKSDFTRTYCTPKTENDPGLFYCTLLDLTLDPVTNEPIVALAEYFEKNARKFYSVDILPLKGCSISVPMEIDLQKKNDGEATTENQSKQ